MMLKIKGLLGTIRFSYSKKIIAGYTTRLVQQAKRDFIAGMRRPKTGRWYNKIQASAPGEYPTIRTGGLLSTITTYSNYKYAMIGTSAPYSGYLAYGTIFMAPRNMSREALLEGLQKTKFRFPLMAYRVIK